MGKFLAILLVAAALVAGVGMYYLQVYHYYEEVEPEAGRAVELTSRVTGEAEPVPNDGFRGIDADSSPIRYRACFTTPASPAALTERFEPYGEAVPLTAPGWFDCFDAEELGAALESGEALAFLGEKNIRYGIDRVVAVHEDGRGFVWHQINRCGEIVFDGKPAPEDCPEPPEGY
jgi:hypothetical protein